MEVIKMTMPNKPVEQTTEIEVTQDTPKETEQPKAPKKVNKKEPEKQVSASIVVESKGVIYEVDGVRLSPRELFKQVQQLMVVGKKRLNKFGNFNYRNIEDIFAAFKALGVPLTLTLTDRLVAVLDNVFIEATATIKDLEGNVIEATQAHAQIGKGKAGMSTEQATGSASTYARKYALDGLFLLNTVDDPDSFDNSQQGKDGEVTTVSNTAAIKELQELIRGDAVKIKLATDLLKGRALLKMPVQEILEIIDKVKASGVPEESPEQPKE